ADDHRLRVAHKFASANRGSESGYLGRCRHYRRGRDRRRSLSKKEGLIMASPQQQVWATGDFSMVGTMVTVVGELLCDSVPVHAGNRALDVATGSGNTALAAARRGCKTAGVDFVPALLERARERAAAERLKIEFKEGDANSIPFEDESFD